MQIQKQKVRCKRIRKSQLLLFGSLLIFLSILIFSSDYITKLKKEVFSEMELEINGDSLSPDNIEEKLEDVPITNEIPKEEPVPVEKPKPIIKPIDYSKYYGVLEIPKIGLKRGFYNLGHRYNNISYNVTMVKGSKMPDIEKSNLILMAHSGPGRIGFFSRLYNLKIDDEAYITYNNIKYSYKIVNIYNVPKTGNVKVVRNYDKTVLTLITCTKNDNTSQTVYIMELV